MDSNLIAYLSEGIEHHIKDPLWKDIPFTTPYKDLLLQKSVQRMNSIRQNGPTFHIYPGAVHTRLGHSIGVYALSRQIIHTLLEQSDIPLTREGIASFLASALLHDIGHFPYAHSLKELPIASHEALAAKIIEEDKDLNQAIARTGANPDLVKAIIDESLPAVSDECRMYRSLLSGTLDPDKLDYLNRDAYYAGVPYGIQDTSFIITSFRYAKGKVCLESSAMTSIEHLLFGKYLMYRTVYWHKGVRSATAMIKKALILALKDGIIRKEELYYLTDSSFDALPKTYRGFLPFSLIDSVCENRLLPRTISLSLRENPELTSRVKNLESRSILEKELYQALKPTHPELKEWECIIDVPEPISFEADMPLLMEGGNVENFLSVDPLFTHSVIDQFAQSLSHIDFYMPQTIFPDEIKEVLS